MEIKAIFAFNGSGFHIYLLIRIKDYEFDIINIGHNEYLTNFVILNIPFFERVGSIFSLFGKVFNK